MKKFDGLLKDIWTWIALIFIGLGALGALNKYVITGEHAFGVTNDVPWGALIAGYVFFAAAATGTGLVASLGHVFRIKKFEMFSKRALLASILLLMGAFMVLAVELSNPFHMIHMLFTPNLDSAIFWMGAFYGVYLVLLFAEFFFTMKNNHKIATPIAYLSFVVKLAALTNLGRVFGFSLSRDFWFGLYYPAYMLVTAVVSGAAVLTILAYLIGRDSAKFEYHGKNIIHTLGKILGGGIIVYAGAEIFQIGTSLASSQTASSQSALALLTGPIAPAFWIFQVGIGIALPLYLLFSSKSTQIGRTFWAAIFTMFGLMHARLNFVYAGQIYPLEVVPKAEMPILEYQPYLATWSEWGMVLAALGFVYLVFRLAELTFDLDTSH